MDDQNERNFRNNKGRPVADVLADWRSILDTLLSALEHLPEERLAGTTRYGWLYGENLGQGSKMKAMVISKSTSLIWSAG